jgi:hypothetical protein
MNRSMASTVFSTLSRTSAALTKASRGAQRAAARRMA